MTDDRLERIIGNLLRAGVGLSAAVALTGGVWYLTVSAGAHSDYHRFHPAPHGIRALSELPLPLAVIEVGLLILIATPIARVAFSLVAFTLEHDWRYVAITLVVLLILLYSFGTAFA